MNDITFQNEHNNPWFKLSKDYWRELTDKLTPVSYSKNTVIYNQGDSLKHAFIVKSGRVRLGYYSKDGEEMGIYIAEENGIFGETVALPGYQTNYTATAIVDSEIYQVPVNLLLQTIKNNSDFALKMILMLSHKVRIYSSQEIELSSTETYERICHALLYLAQTYGKETKDGIKISIKFTHQELANMTHLSRVSVSNVFSELSKEDIVIKKDGFYIITRIDMLLNI